MFSSHKDTLFTLVSGETMALVHFPPWSVHSFTPMWTQKEWTGVNPDLNSRDAGMTVPVLTHVEFPHTADIQFMPE